MFDPNHFSLHAKQTEIDDKKEMCEIQIDKFEDDIEALDITVPDVEKSIVEDKENDSSDEKKALEDIWPEDGSDQDNSEHLVSCDLIDTDEAPSGDIGALTTSHQELVKVKYSKAAKENVFNDTNEDLTESKKSLADLEWAEAMQTQEILALADTIKVLSDENALELFKKTLPSVAAVSCRSR